ncbi:heat-shock protein [Clostridium polyendosporum]|uniref:Heat-shock protein n=1 Tax=Clostridium polyendosporum TaxID=69208 RepID=A0A919RYN4_9CLOT|nr:Hsp20 family protein [Clostridium polyendosporum]GIM28955.1 heat-shock protein [Clostridium polyendosporum]
MLSLLPMRSTNFMTSKEFFDLVWNDVFCEKKLPFLCNNENFKVDLQENDNYYIINADLPGVGKKDIEINYIDNFLVISAHRKKNIDHNFSTLVQEKPYGEFRRMFYVSDINLKKISTSFYNGELKLTIPKLK